MSFLWPFKIQFHKMVKHTLTICRQFADELFECVWPFFVKLALKGLRFNFICGIFKSWRRQNVLIFDIVNSKYDNNFPKYQKQNFQDLHKGHI